MIKLYYGANLENIEWKIYLDYGNKFKWISSDQSPWDLVDSITQPRLFNDIDAKSIFVINIENWKLTDDNVKQSITELSNVESLILMIHVGSTFKNKTFTSLKIETIKCNAVSKITKRNTISSIIKDYNLNIDNDAEEAFIELVPNNINFVKNEINKLKLLNKQTITTSDIKNVVFELGEATIFNIVDSWLNKDNQQVIERLNDLMSKNITIQMLVPIFASKLIQIKLFLQAKIANWSSQDITNRLSMPIWQQTNYYGLKPYDKSLNRINKTLNDLYQFDINVKKQKNISYTQLIKILLN